MTADIQVSVANASSINVQLATATSTASVEADTPFYFDGASGDTYLKYNSTTGRLEVWVDGSKKTQF